MIKTPRFRVDSRRGHRYPPRTFRLRRSPGQCPRAREPARTRPMKVINSLKSAKKRDKNCRVVRRKGRVYIINKSNPRNARRLWLAF